MMTRSGVEDGETNEDRRTRRRSMKKTMNPRRPVFLPRLLPTNFSRYPHSEKVVSKEIGKTRLPNNLKLDEGD